MDLRLVSKPADRTKIRFELIQHRKERRNPWSRTYIFPDCRQVQDIPTFLINIHAFDCTNKGQSVLRHKTDKSILDFRERARLPGGVECRQCLGCRGGFPPCETFHLRRMSGSYAGVVSCYTSDCWRM